MPEVAHNPVTTSFLPPTAPGLETETAALRERPFVSDDAVRARASDIAMKMQRLQPARHPADLKMRLEELSLRLEELMRACKARVSSTKVTPWLELLESGRAFQSVLTGLMLSLKQFDRVPYVRVPSGAVPRVLHVAEQYIAAADGIWSQQTLVLFVETAEQQDPLLLREVNLLPGCLKLAQLEFVLNSADEVFASGAMPSVEQSPFSAPIHSLRRMNQFEWQPVLEALVIFHRVLEQDPVGAYARMEEETRASYRQRVAELAADSNYSELQVAEAAVEMSLDAAAIPNHDLRLHRRRSHVGYYLFEEGFKELSRRIGYDSPTGEKIRAALRRQNENVYILGIYFFSAMLIVIFIGPIVPHHIDFLAVMGALLLALLPAAQGASDLVNNAVTAIFSPRALPKLDFSKGIPEDETTFVVVPTLLLDEAQVREAYEDLEARYLSNRDPNLHFGLLTDLPDSHERPQLEDRSAVVDLAVQDYQ